MRYAVELGGERFSMESTQGLFSPERADAGTLAMLSVVTLEPEQRVLDLGCGCGLVGIYAARRCGAHNVWMTDIDSKAVEYARRNAQANGAEGVHISCGDAFEAVEASEFDWILTNAREVFGLTARNRINKGFPGHTPLFLCPEIRAVRHRMAA
ncbi:MAG: methyltransferase [Clostridia bacterium]|nr:methyltransferase [Clostridia bacterium]